VTVVARWAPQRGPIYFVILLGIAFWAEVAVVVVDAPVRILPPVNDRVQGGVALRGIRAAVTEARNAQHGGPSVDVRPTARGDAGVVEGAAKQLLAQVVADQKSYLAEISALGYPGFMAPERLAADRGLRTTRARLSQAQAIIQKYRALHGARLRGYRDGINQSSLSEPTKQQLVSQLDADYSARMAETDRLWDLEAQMFGEYQQAVEGLARAEGRWTARGHALVFYDHADLVAYNSHIQRAKSDAQAESALREANRVKVNNELSKLIDDNTRAQANGQ